MQAKKMKPLFCFKLDEETGILTKYEIKDWRKVELSRWTGRCAFFYEHELGKEYKSKYEVYESNLDRFVNWKVHTFDPDDGHALRIILDAILEKERKAQADLDRWQDVRAGIEMNAEEVK